MNNVVSIIITAFNEETTIRSILRKTLKASTGVFRKEIIVVDDGSTDKTKSRVTSYIRKTKNVSLISYAKNHGKGFAVKAGLASVTGDVVLIQDADLEYNPKDYETMLQVFSSRRNSVLYGSRNLGRKLYGSTYSKLHFYVCSIFLSKVINALYSVSLTDQATGYKLFRR